jgi:hypothetical protein
MKRVFTAIAFLTILGTFVWANSAPVVSGVTASQRNDDSKLVDIYYNLADADGNACTVWVVISVNGGSTWDVPAMTFTGAIGQSVSPGTNKHVIWDAGRDIPGKTGSTFKARVYADDGQGDPMVLVPSGYYKVDGSTDQFVNAYMIDKYEVTNTQYCEFLNDYDPTSQYWTSSQQITRFGSSGSYYYTVITGKENYPVIYVSFNDATAYATWKSQKTGQNYHLPDKYQWQKAAGWDPVLQKLWTYGCQRDSIDCSWANFYYTSSCYGGPLPVGSFNGTGGKNDAKSYYGCYDMCGNLWEWTTEVSGSYRVLRGGGWSDYATVCAVAYALSDAPSYRRSYIGFRLVLQLE